MKYLDCNNQTVKEYNKILKEGLEKGIVLANQDDIKTMIEFAHNVNYYLAYFINAAYLRS